LFKQRARTGTSRVEPPPRPAPYDPDDPKFIAMHEAGHAVAAIVLGFDLKSVDIVGRQTPEVEILGVADSGRVHGSELAGKGEEVGLPHIIHSWAGPLAESRVNPHVRDREYEAHRLDVESAYRFAVLSICNPTTGADGLREITREERMRNVDRVQALLHRGVVEAAKLVQTYRPAIEEVAALLLKRKRLTGTEVVAIVDPYRAARIAPTVP
jgi:hypothetical protein